MFACLWNFFDWLDQPVTTSTPGMDGKKVVQGAGAGPAGRRKSGGDVGGVAAGVRRRSGPQGLRSPAAKRPLSAPVALQGWLHKQGSEGLMLWKKRWFVLSEYCLFYYKGPEEEKLLGSILLPSYRVTICRPEDKVAKKFAFKAEHANMRTYLFAADSRERMNQWVNALTLATLLQDPNPGGGEAPVALEIAGPADGERSARPSVSSISSILNQSADDSDSGFHGFQSRDDPSHASNNNSSPNSANTASFPNLSTNGSSGTGQDGQPHPLINGWMQQPYAQAGTSQQHQVQHQVQHPGQLQVQHQVQHPVQHQGQQVQHQVQHQGQHQVQHQVQVQHQHQHQVNPPSSPQQQFQLQVHPHQHLPHQYKQQVHQQQQVQQAAGPSNVQTVQPMPRNFGQPVYANAPPKPRRLTDGSNDYSTPSPDPDYRRSPVSPDVRVAAKSPIAEYERNGPVYVASTRMPGALRTDRSGLNYGYGQVQSTERRTPDTYGRSAKPRGSRPSGDYEDVYAGPQLYQRPAGPVGYTKAPTPAPIPIPGYGQQHPQMYVPAPSNGQPRQVRVQPPPRPHSADFLEYEATRRPHQQVPTFAEDLSTQQRRPQRPKSSLDIVNPSDVSPSDGYFYSEERYAAQMRQSAVYLHQTPQQHQQQRNQSLSRAATPSKTTSTRDVEPAIVPGLDGSCPALKRSLREHGHQQQVLSQSLQRYSEMSSNEAVLRRSLRERSYEMPLQEGGTVPRRAQRDYEVTNGRTSMGHPGHAVLVGQGQYHHSGHGSRRWNEQVLQHQQQQFSRSASARLPRTRHPAGGDPEENPYEQSPSQDARDGERKIQQREESMKRLLEWKQRMLQSPLTRKPSGSAHRSSGPNELSSYYKRQALLDLAAHEATLAEARHSRRRDDGHRSHPRSKSSDGRRSANNVSRYNSYSSDDEELGDVRRKRSRRPSHAVRSPRHFGEDRSSGTSGHENQSAGGIRPLQEVLPPGTSSGPPGPRGNQSRTPSSDPSLVCIPPDTGYEEIGFGSPTSHQGRSSRSSSRSPRKPEPPEQFADTCQSVSKKPCGILKTPSTYPGLSPGTPGSSDQGRHRGRGGTREVEVSKMGTLAGVLPRESWQGRSVQWESRNDPEEWDQGEEEDVEEFLRGEDVDVKNEGEEGCTSESLNSVRSRIRSFEVGEEGQGKESLAMQEPLKMSPPQATEAHVSRLESTRNGSAIREFALGEVEDPEEVGRQVEEDSKQRNDANKTVKDLLADFERKSQQVRMQEDERDEEAQKHRGVFSDTETLLYDTGSEVDQRERSEEEDEENDEEDVEEDAEEEEKRATSGVESKEEYTGTIKRKRDLERRRRKLPGKPGERVLASEDLDVVQPPGYNRLSVSESLVTHGDRLSGESAAPSPSPNPEEPSPEEHYLPMTPRKAILDPNNDDRPNSKMMESLFADLDHEESSYVEMTQNGMGHSLLAPNEDGKHDSGDYSTLDTPHYEFVRVADSKMEPVYMEVSQLAEKEEKGTLKKTKKRDQGVEAPSRSDLPDILTTLKSDSSDADDESSKDLDSLDAPRHPRFSLSDTFRPASYYLGASRALMAELHDSSDSELVSPPPIPTSPPPLDDLDSLDMQDILEKKSSRSTLTRDNSSSTESPKSWNKPTGQVESHGSPSRFSDATVSSTFRDSRISLESVSGSDSVELRNPEEEARHRQMKRRPVSDEVCEVLDSLDELESLGSRFDGGTSIDLDQYLEELQARDAFNVDLYAKDLSYNGIYGFNENTLASEKLQKTAYPDLGTGKMNLDQPFLKYGARSKTSSASSLPAMRVSDVPPAHQHSQSFTGDAHYENVGSFSPLGGSPAMKSDGGVIQGGQGHLQSVQHQGGQLFQGVQGSSMVPVGRDSCYSPFSSAPASGSGLSQRPGSAQSSSNSSSNQVTRNHSREASQDSTRYSPLSPNHRSSSSQDSSQYPPSTSTVKANPRTRHSPGVGGGGPPGPGPGQSDQSGAPYYYSDLQAGSSGMESSRPSPMTHHTPRLPQLNNQRGDSILNKRNDIGRMVNPISRHMPRQIQVVDIDEARRIAAELRKTSQFTHFLAASKSGLVDKRNLYEADTLRRVKSTDPLPDPSPKDLIARNLYPQALRDKFESQPQIPTTSQTSHRRSRSLEGLLDDAGLQSLVERRTRISETPSGLDPESRTAAPDSGPAEDSNRADTFQGEDPWEQDSLWRESLRRVSLRHARSLENLDLPQPRESRGRVKLTRGATYVNDSVAALRRNASSPEEARGLGTLKRRSGEDVTTKKDDPEDVYDRVGVGGYVWDPENEAYRRCTSSGRHFLAEGNLPPARPGPEARTSTSTSAPFELDREKLRQWDLLSSACLLQERQRTSTADSGRGLPTPQEARGDQPGGPKGHPPGNDLEDPGPGSASGSGSVIGRDPLPPRAVSTSQLPQRTLTQPPAGLSTLPLSKTPSRAIDVHRQPLPVHQSTPQASGRQLDRVEILRAASSGDVRLCPTSSQEILKDLPRQRVVSPAGVARTQVEHRVSSPSDSEMQPQSPGERRTSPASREVDRGGGPRHHPRGSRPGKDLSQKGARLAELDTPRRLENWQKLEELQKHLMDLEKQYEKGKPLVNLVDNMVKLGSLYNHGNHPNGTVGGSRQDLLHGLDPAKEHRDRLEFNQRVQEQRLLAEERRDWDRLSPDHGQLQAKVQQLYKLDRLLQEESGTLHSLQQDKEILEKALGGLRHKMQSSRSNPVETERYRKQQLLLERELSRVRLLLAHNSKKLEETVAENARLEQELVVLRQKLQASRRYAGNMARDPSGTTAALEAELRRVQQLVGDLQRQRQELSVQVRQLTEKSHSLVQQIRPQSAAAPQVHQSKKRTHSSWLETDLDSGTTLDHGLDSPSSPALSTSPRSGQNSHQASPRFKDPPAPYKENFPRYSPPIQDSQSFGQTLPSQNHISALSPQLREQIQQHQLKQQQLRDRMQGKGSPVQANVAPLYVNTESRRQDVPKHGEVGLSNGPIPPPEYVPPPPPPPSEEALLVNGGVYGHAEENKFPGLLHGREKQEIKTVRIVKRESERRQRDRGDRTGNLGIPLTNGLPVPGGAKRLAEEESSQQLEKAQLGRVVEESPMTHAQSTVQLSELDEVQFQRSMSLPRGFGGQRPQPGIHQGLLQGPVPPPPRSDSMNALRNMMARRHRVRQFEHQDASSDSTLSPYTESPTSTSMANSSPNYSTSPSAYSPSHQNYQAQGARAISNYLQVGPYGSIPSLAKEGNQVPGNSTAVSPVPPRDRFFGSAASINSLSESPQLSPVFKSEAARQIIKEMTEKRSEGPRRRQVPKEKRRHYTVSSSKPVFDLEDTFSKMGMGRARDDLDMERALRPRINAPDVVRSTLSHKELKYNESTIDQLLGTPNKILIPERYIPEQTPELSAEEQEHRLKKAESIRKMLSETAVTAPEGGDDEMEKSDTLKKKVAEEKRQREHILQLNQILAKQVMEKSKMVAVQALATLPLNQEPSFDEDDLSPVTPLPLYQQRENYYS